MPRRARALVGGYAYHVLNRANGKARLFSKPSDYMAFESIMAAAYERVPLRVLGYVVMNNHWHFVVWPKRGQDEEVSEFFRWLTVTHAQRFHAHQGTSGLGHVYQGRFKAFPIAGDDHLLSVLRYVERNPLRANLTQRAEDYRWGSLYRRVKGLAAEPPPLAQCPVALGTSWVEHVNRPQTESEVLAIGESIRRGRPYGGDAWQHNVAKQLDLEHTFRPRGRPRQRKGDGSL